MSRYPAIWTPWRYLAADGEPAFYRGQNHPTAVVLHAGLGAACTHSGSATGAAASAACLTEVGIGFIERVTPNTASPIREPGHNGLSTQHVVSASHGLQVRWLNASSIAAEVINLQPSGYRPGLPFIRPSVRINLPSIHPEDPVSGTVRGRPPQKALSGALYFGREPDIGMYFGSRHLTLPVALQGTV